VCVRWCHVSANPNKRHDTSATNNINIFSLSLYLIPSICLFRYTLRYINIYIYSFTLYTVLSWAPFELSHPSTTRPSSPTPSTTNTRKYRRRVNKFKEIWKKKQTKNKNLSCLFSSSSLGLGPSLVRLQPATSSSFRLHTKNFFCAPVPGHSGPESGHSYTHTHTHTHTHKYIASGNPKSWQLWDASVKYLWVKI
jgi:hypothetical protein